MPKGLARASSNRFQVVRNRILVYSAAMLTIPIPLVVALILGFLALRHTLAPDRSALFVALLAVCAFQSLIVSLVQHYGVSWLTMMQPITASLIPPVAWLTFQSAALRPMDPKRDGLHLLGPTFVVFCMVFAPLTLDAVLTSMFVIYGAAILFRLRRDEALPLVRLESGPLPARIWKALGALLILSALSDLLIAVAMGMGKADWRPLIISVFTSVTLLGIGLLSLSRDAEGPAEADPAETEPEKSPPSEEHEALIARLDALMQHDQPYLDPDLSLARIARRLHVPAKQLSLAINLVKGENVSRYVNEFRIRNACARLESGDTVTEAMLSSGFNTKSNFNREFGRVMGQTPTAFVRSRQVEPRVRSLTSKAVKTGPCTRL
ncbi:MAG: AraC family transcriptional regulator [Pseudomonadota bacterium]